jgi:hypothetical protein
VKLIKATAPNAATGTLGTLGIDLATFVGFGLAFLGIVGIIIQTAASNATLLPISNSTLLTLTAATAGATALLRMIASGLLNNGIVIQTGELTKVEILLSTYVGYGVAALSAIAALIASNASVIEQLHISQGRLGEVAAALAIATTAGRLIQTMLQNHGLTLSVFTKG